MEKRAITTELFVNGIAHLLDAATLADVVRQQGLEGGKIATALNGQFIPAAARATTVVVTGDKVEIVSARQGG